MSELEHIRDLHLISHADGDRIGYDPSTNQIIDLTDGLFNAIDQLQKGTNLHELENQFKGVTNVLTALEEQLQAVQTRLEKQFAEIDQKKLGLKSIGRITLHVANDCNLRCSYCYAMGGGYGGKRGLMTTKTASDIVHFLVTRFDIIEHIVFFGGEPLMNMPVIELICKQLNDAYQKGNLKKQTKFGIITNGTLLNDHALEIIKRYISFITVSVDGPAPLHDFNRKQIDGQGSFHLVDQFIRTIQRETNVELSYESTISQEHIRQNFTGSQIAEFMQQTYGLHGSVATNILSEDKRHIVRDELPTLKSNGKKILGLDEAYFYGNGLELLLPAIVYGTYHEMCPVGFNIISLSVEGDFYPCHICVGKKHLSLGTIYADNIFDNETAYLERFPYLVSVEKRNKTCLTCWQRRLCGGCAIRWFFELERETFRNDPLPIMCQKQGHDIETMLVGLARDRRDPKAWQELKARLAKQNPQLAC